MKRATLYALALAVIISLPVAAQQVSLQGPVNNIQGNNPTLPMMRFNPARTQTGNQVEWHGLDQSLVTFIGPNGIPSFSGGFTLPNGVILAPNGANVWDGMKLTKSITVGPTVGNEAVNTFIEINRTAAIVDQATITAVEAVARARNQGRELTIRGGNFRTYIDDTLGGSAITSVGIDGSVRASGAVAADPGTAFVGIRSYMAPGFTGPTLANVTNFHAFWAYNESDTQAVTNAYYASAAAGGFTNGLNLSGTTIAATGGQVIFSNGIYLYAGAQTTRAAVLAEVGAGGAIGSTYYSTAGKQYVKVANAGANTDWERVTTTAAD
jgi:hypothetical protein